VADDRKGQNSQGRRTEEQRPRKGREEAEDAAGTDFQQAGKPMSTTVFMTVPTRSWGETGLQMGIIDRKSLPRLSQGVVIQP